MGFVCLACLFNVQIGLPGFDTVLLNASGRFFKSLSACCLGLSVKLLPFVLLSFSFCPSYLYVFKFFLLLLLLSVQCYV